MLRHQSYKLGLIVLSMILIFNCSEVDNPTSNQNFTDNLNNETAPGMVIETAYFPSDLMPAALASPENNQLARTGCTFYPFTDGDYDIHNTYEDITFIYYPGVDVSQAWLQFEQSSVLSWYPTLMELPETAASINLDILDNENWEEWFPGSGFYRAIGCTMILYNQEMEQVGEFVTDANSDWQNMTLATDDGSVFKYIGFVGKYSEDESNPYAGRYVRFKNVTICYAPPCTAPEVTLVASQTTIWPPNNSTVTVNYAGLITNDCGGAEYVLTDEYGELNYEGTLDAGSYSLDLDLIASRLGNDSDGRTYTFTITATNDIGSALQSSDVIVLHDKGKKKRGH